jgi:hypothetical protein
VPISSINGRAASGGDPGSRCAIAGGAAARAARTARAGAAYSGDVDAGDGNRAADMGMAEAYSRLALAAYHTRRKAA